MSLPRPAAAFLFTLGLCLPGHLQAAADSAAPTPFEQRVLLNSRWDLGYYLFQLQEYAAAAAEFEKIRAVLPDDASLLALIGSCHSMAGQWNQGEKVLLEAAARNPEDEDINGLLGQFYLSAGQPLKGAAYLEHSLRITPDQEELRARLASLYLDAGRGDRARYHLEILLNAKGGEGFGNPELDHEYARSLVHDGEFEKAMPFAERANKAEPGNPRFARVLGLCLMGTRRYGEAAQMLAAGRNELQAEELIYLQWGEALFLDRRWEDAEVVWLEGVGRLPASYELLARLMDYYIGAAKPGRARRVLEFGHERNPEHPGNLLLEARLNRRLSGYARAEKALTRLKRQACGPMAKEALWEEAQLAYATGKFSNCGRILDNLLLAKYRKAEAHTLKAKLAMLSGNKTLAQASLGVPFTLARSTR